MRTNGNGNHLWVCDILCLWVKSKAGLEKAGSRRLCWDGIEWIASIRFGSARLGSVLFASDWIKLVWYLSSLYECYTRLLFEIIEMIQEYRNIISIFNFNIWAATVAELSGQEAEFLCLQTEPIVWQSLFHSLSIKVQTHYMCIEVCVRKVAGIDEKLERAK